MSNHEQHVVNVVNDMKRAVYLLSTIQMSSMRNLMVFSSNSYTSSSILTQSNLASYFIENMQSLRRDLCNLLP